MRESGWPPHKESNDPASGKEEGQKEGLSRRSLLKGFLAVAAIKLSGTDKLEAIMTDTEGSHELESALIKVEKQATELESVLENVYQESRKEIAPEVWRKVDTIFSGPLETVRAWNRELVQEGRYAHIAAYLLQDFRNSEEAAWLRETYNSLSAEKRPQLEAKIKERIRNPLTFELMFKIGLRPSVFDPRLNPANNVTAHRVGEQATLEVVRDSKGRVVYSGTDQYFFDDPKKVDYEGSYSYAYNEDGKGVAIVNYFKNAQPNFRFIRNADSLSDPDDFDFFKTYLGNDLKGKDLYYSVHQVGKEPWEKRVDLTDEQIEALKKFFRWR